MRGPAIFKKRLKQSYNRIAGSVAVGLFKILRRCDTDRSIDRAGRLLRKLGPHLREHRIGRANLAASFPEKSSAEIDGLLLDAWEHLGRYGAEFGLLDRLWDYDPTGQRPGRIAANATD